MSLIDPLRVTTRTPIWVHPLLWRPDHLDAFHISISTVTTTDTANPPGGRGRATLVGHGFISSRDLRYILQDINLLETYLASFIARIINSFQKALKPRPFRFYSQDQHPKPPSPLFTFLDHVMQIHPELVIRTRKGFPFLIYNCPGTIYALRHNFPKTRAGSNIEWLLKQTVVKLNFSLEVMDPYNVAAVLAVAQEQHAWFCRSNRTTPNILKVYLITPHPTIAAVYFHTAEVPLWYLKALMDPCLKVAGKVNIFKELVDLPVPPVSGQAVITTGPFLNKLGEILGDMIIF